MAQVCWLFGTQVMHLQAAGYDDFLRRDSIKRMRVG